MKLLVVSCPIKQFLGWTIFLSIITLQGVGFALPGYVPQEISGTQALRSGDAKMALREIQSDTAIQDSVFRLFKLGCVYDEMGDHSKALLYFRLCAQKDSTFAPFAYERIADIEIKLKRYETALKAFRVSFERASAESYQQLLLKKIYDLIQNHTAEISTPIVWFEELLNKTVQISQPLEKETPPPDTLRDRLAAASVDSIDRLLLGFKDSLVMTRDQKCFICSLVTAQKMGERSFSTRTLFFLADAAYTCKRFKEADRWFSAAHKRKNFSKEVPAKTALYFQIQLENALREYKKVIPLVLKYNKEFKPEAGLLYILARAYRSLGNDDKATYWYDKHIELFPQKERTQEIIWYRAWQFEEAGKHGEARKLFRELFSKSKKKEKEKEKAADAHFRYGLSFYKEGLFDSSSAVFAAWLKRHSNFSLQVASYYWKAQCHYQLKQVDSVRQLCGYIIRNWPVNFYSYRSKELLSQLGDSTAALPFNSSMAPEKTSQWLDTLSGLTVKALSDTDSVRFYLSTCLASIGMQTHADALLENIIKGYPDNLALQFKICQFYMLYNNPTKSFGIARQFSWKIPQQVRLQTPVHIYTMLYPKAFMDYIEPNAAARDLEPELVYALVRQESIFNPTIVSPVGAIGLMQIMPYTGEEIAGDLNERFVKDSLYHPAYNVRYGTYYLKKLLKQFDGNLILAIASYNGGPHNAKRWQEVNKDDSFDLFIEDIGFNETRNYVKKVLENYWTYKNLKGFRIVRLPGV